MHYHGVASHKCYHKTGVGLLITAKARSPVNQDQVIVVNAGMFVFNGPVLSGLGMHY